MARWSWDPYVRYQVAVASDCSWPILPIRKGLLFHSRAGKRPPNSRPIAGVENRPEAAAQDPPDSVKASKVGGSPQIITASPLCMITCHLPDKARLQNENEDGPQGSFWVV